MRLIIAGGRECRLTDGERLVLEVLHALYNISTVVSGGAVGIDRDGEVWAAENNIPVRRFPPNYAAHPKSLAPVIRNSQMADYTDACICFRGKRGTADMANKAKAKGLMFWDFKGPQP